MTIRCMQDIEQLESTPLTSYDLPSSTYAALQRATQAHPQAKALSFF